MKKMIFATLVILQGCGGSSSGSGSGSGSGVTSDFNSVYEALAESAPEMNSSKSYINFSSKSINETITLWSNASNAFMGVSSTSKNPKGFVSDLFDSSVDQSMLERARMPFLMSCCMDILAPKTGELFTEGTHTIEVTNEVVGVCGTEAELGGMEGQSITITVSNLADTTNYDQVIFFDHAENPMFSNEDQWMYIKNNSSVLNFMHIGDTSSGFDGSMIDVKSIKYNKINETGSFQGITNSSPRIYRIHFDSDNNDVRAFAYKDNNGEIVSVNAASTFNNQTHVALSMSYSGLSAPYDTDKTNVQACIATADASIAEDNTATCTSNSLTVLDSSGASALETAVSAFDGAALRADAASGDLDDNLPSFTAGTILSAGIQL